MSQVAPAPRRSPVAAFFVGLWDVANFTRKLVLNLIFFGLLFLVFIFFIIAAGSGGVKPLMERTTFVLAPEGRLVEQFTADPATRALAKALGDKSAEEVQLRDLLRAIEAAQKDEKIERMLLRVDQLQPTGYASLREVAAALAKFRASGKQIVAFGENLSQTQYLLAAQADEVYLDPMGSLMLEGLGRYRQYYRKALQDKDMKEAQRTGQVDGMPNDPVTLLKDGRVHYRDIPKQQSLEDWNDFWQEYKNAS